ncbi:MAG TPA: HD domain-containing protein [Streptosporangiaceae bacterium]
MTELDDLLTIPTEDWARAALEFVLASEPQPVAYHSIRSYFFARLLAEHEGTRGEADGRLLFAATVLHDIGLGADVTSQDRFEVAGADRAAGFLRAHGLGEREIDVVWEAIALHTSPGIAERRGAVARLTRAGIGIDFGQNAGIVGDDQARRIHDAYPRLSMATSLVDAIVAQCRRSPAKGPRYSIAGELARERSAPPYVTQLEQMVSTSRWGS